MKKKRKKQLQSAVSADAARAQSAARERGPRRLLAAGGALLMIALAVVGIGESDVGAWLAIGALILVIYGVHRFGRLGPDLPAPRESAQGSRGLPDGDAA